MIIESRMDEIFERIKAKDIGPLAVFQGMRGIIKYLSAELEGYQKATELSGKVNSKLMQELLDKPAVAVPKKLPVIETGKDKETSPAHRYVKGWNDCIDAMLAVAPSHSQQSSDKNKLLEIGYLALCLDVFDDEEAKIRQKIFDIVKEQCGITDKELFSLPEKYIDRCPSHESDQQNKNTEGK